MNFVVVMPNGKFVHKSDGMNNFVRNPNKATRYDTKEAAESGKVGHHSDMGGSGFRGRIMTFDAARREWEHRNCQCYCSGDYDE
jgi:hypothetical protein